MYQDFDLIMTQFLLTKTTKHVLTS